MGLVWLAVLGSALSACGAGAPADSVPNFLPVDGTPDPQRSRLSPPGSVEPVQHLSTPPPGSVAMPWEFVSLSTDQRELTIRYLPSVPCRNPVGIVVTETPEAVSVTPVAGPKLETCPAVFITPRFGAIELQEPLGKRALLHGIPLEGTQLPAK